MAESTHKCEVVPLILEKHPNPEVHSLSVAKVHGFTCVVNTKQWEGINKAIYIQPDSLVDVTRKEFTFLATDARPKYAGKARVKAKKLKGVLSFGLLVPAPDYAEIGQDFAKILEVEHYEPAIASVSQESGLSFGGGEIESPPNLYTCKYDVEAGRRYSEKTFIDGELVVISEKIHGSNSRYVFHNNKMYCGSRTEWKREYANYDSVTTDVLIPQILKKNEKNKDNPDYEVISEELALERANEIIEKLKSSSKKQNLWWKILREVPQIEEFCKQNPDHILYGEVVNVQKGFNYGCLNAKGGFFGFDIMKDGKWLEPEEAFRLARKSSVPWVPLINADTGFSGQPDDFIVSKYNFERICQLAEGKTLVANANHVREGVVVKSLKEREDDKYKQRACLKWVGCDYLSKE